MSINLQSHAFAGNPIRSKTPKSNDPFSPTSALESLKIRLLDKTHQQQHSSSSPDVKVLPFRKGMPLSSSRPVKQRRFGIWLGTASPITKFLANSWAALREESLVFLGARSEDDVVYWAIDVSADSSLVSELGSEQFCLVEMRTLMVAIGLDGLDFIISGIIEVRQVNENDENNGQIVNQDHVGVNSSTKNKRRKESKVWEEMRKYKGEDGKVWAKCGHCENEFDGSSKKGTTHLKNHLERCKRKRNIGDADQSMNATNDDLTSPVVIKEKSVIDLINHSFNEKGFRTEHWDPLLLNSRKLDILQVYEQEKETLHRFLSKLSCRFNLRIEWFLGWRLLTIHYIDDSWEPKRMFVSMQNARHENGNLIASLKESCLDWKIERNICSIVDHYHNDEDDGIGEINSWFKQRSSLPFCGFLFSVDALSYILNDFNTFLEYDVWCTFDGINKCIGYVSRPSNKHKFQIAVDNAKTVTPQHLLPDACSFENFGIVLGYQEAFCELDRIEPEFRSINLEKEKWDETTAAYKRWKETNDICGSLHRSNHTTTNVYFPKFCKLYMELLQRETSTEGYHLGKKSFVKYLSQSNLVVVTAVILDPRFKMDIVRLWYIKIYGDAADHYLQEIIEEFTFVFDEYAESSESGDGSTSSTTGGLDALGMPSTSSYDVSPTSELERYLNDPKFPNGTEKFDILAWWRLYTPIFPTLARMARDFLAVPISIGAATSFSLADVKITECVDDCKVLDDDIKPALLCLRRWDQSTEKTKI